MFVVYFGFFIFELSFCEYYFMNFIAF